MKIVVCVKYVPDSTADRGFNSDNTVDRAGVDGVLSELDENAVEAALTIKDTTDAEVTLLTMGPDSARAAILKGLQMGADAGVHVADDAIHGSDAVATSLVLAKALATRDYDVVLCGMASTDGGMSVVPAMLAERLSVPQLTFASEFSIDDGVVRIRRDADTATMTVEAATPLVLSVTDQANEPRYPSFKGIMAAKKKPVKTLTVGDLGIDPSAVGLAGAGTEVVDFAVRPPRQAGVIVKDDGDGGVKAAEFLAARKFI
ncbi:MAG: electron transfer flavoprotein subunit beta/FixA family protein [Nocardioidaceae bacterium]